MDINIREELEKDYEIVDKLTEDAFKNVEHSDGTEHLLVGRLRKGKGFIKELSLVAEDNGKVVAHLMLTKANINNKGNSVETLALAPVSVLPEYQGKGIGSKLINVALESARRLGYKSVIVLGHDKYYPKFGFVPASKYEIRAPFDVPDASFMAKELNDGSLISVSGIVEYAKEFFE
ncbi:Predicted acetyltransferase [uncultured Clostridium sp.]|uniref:GNAT family N-acetyltransferase n=1 Tax=uncultured Clostridium sp. TaxID=59620 RepID=UPI0008220C0A|nr:N-acetyltransferase [uncultured Clostridium sp.]SCJ97532.1 Predicted acetyltransferase [uncultured Clostridium sp.]